MKRWPLIAALGLSAGLAQAHLMVAQRGTLNLQGDGAYMVLSVPVSALQGVDDDGDGLLSRAELRAHRAAIEAMLQDRLRLSQGQRTLPLQGLMLELAPPDETPAAPAAQLVVLGRYRLPDDAQQVRGLRWSIDLYGRDRSEQHYGLTITRGEERQSLVLSTDQPEAALLPRSAAASAPTWARVLVPGLLAVSLLFGLWKLLEGWRVSVWASSASAALRRWRRVRA